MTMHYDDDRGHGLLHINDDTDEGYIEHIERKGEGVMDDLPTCPRCKMKIEVARYWEGKVDAYWNPVFTIYCGCPDCRNFVALNCIVSEAFVGDGTVSPTKRQEFWDSQYEIAVEKWKEKNTVV